MTRNGDASHSGDLIDELAVVVRRGQLRQVALVRLPVLPGNAHPAVDPAGLRDLAGEDDLVAVEGV